MRVRARARLQALMLTGAAACMLSAIRPARGADPSCIETRAEARWVGLGYNHFVWVLNHCDRTAICDVSTSVNPEPQKVTVPPAQVVGVVTFLGSPASAFTARAECQLSR